MKFFLESYGCSLNNAGAEKASGFLSSHGFKPAPIEGAELLVINTCAVKEQTEYRMLNRIRKLHALAKKENKRLIVFGCLPRISPKKVLEISPEIELVGPGLQELAKALRLEFRDSVPVRANEFISIIPVSNGCLNKCAYCAVRLARGELKSQPIEAIKKRFAEAAAETREIWLTAQDTGAYGKDIGASLPQLVSSLLETKGKFRVRVGMMNPNHLSEFYDGFAALFSDERLYRFVHLPVQAGSNRVLKSMNRKYGKELFIELVERLRKDIPDVAISTDVIVGFPGETIKEFEETVELLKQTRPDITNISRYGDRPGTEAEKMPGKLHGREKKGRSRILTDLCARLSLENNRKMVGKTVELLVSEEGRKGNFIGRAPNYKPVALKQDLRGKFVKAKIVDAKASYLVGKIPEN